MKNFKFFGSLPLPPLLEALDANRHRFREITARQDHPESPHRKTESIFLRGPSELTIEAVQGSLEAVDYPAWEVDAFRGAAEEVSAAIGLPLARVMIVSLLPGGVISPHPDGGVYAEATERFHIPLETNPKAWLMVEDEWLSMAPGSVWWFAKHKLHCGANQGDTPRVHLIVDLFKC